MRNKIHVAVLMDCGEDVVVSHLRHPEVKVGTPVWSNPSTDPEPHTDHINAAELVSVVYNEKLNLFLSNI